MNTQISQVGVISADSTRPAPQPALVVQFPDVPMSMSLSDQAHELRIQSEGLLMHAQILDFQRTGKVRYRIKARRHLAAMQALIAARSPEQRAAMELAVGGMPNA